MMKIAIMFIISVACSGCMTGGSTLKNEIDSFLFKDVVLPESTFWSRVVLFSDLLREQIPGGNISCSVDVTQPELRMRCFADSRHLYPSIREQIRNELAANISRTNTVDKIFPWGLTGHRLQALSGNYIDGKTLVLALFASIPWDIEYRRNQITIRIFPEKLDIVEYRQKSFRTGSPRFFTVDDFMLYEHFDKQVFLAHPENPERVFVVAPPCVHKQAFTQLKELRTSSQHPEIFPDVFSGKQEALGDGLCN